MLKNSSCLPLPDSSFVVCGPLSKCFFFFPRQKRGEERHNGTKLIFKHSHSLTLTLLKVLLEYQGSLEKVPIFSLSLSLSFFLALNHSATKLPTNLHTHPSLSLLLFLSFSLSLSVKGPPIHFRKSIFSAQLFLQLFFLPPPLPSLITEIFKLCVHPGCDILYR